MKQNGVIQKLGLKHLVPVLALLLSFHQSVAQSPVNWSFETNSGSCVYNIPNATYNANMGSSTGFGIASQLDIISTACGYGAAQNGTWFVALAVDITNTQNDAFSMTLSAPLVMGNSYTLTFYDRGWAPYATNRLDIGISTTASTFGTSIYTTPLPTIGTWVLRTVPFVAPSNGQYLTIRTIVGAYGWTHVDNFQIAAVLPVNDLHLQGVALDGTLDSLFWQSPVGQEQEPAELQIMTPEGEFVSAPISVEGNVQGQMNAFLCDPGTAGDHRYRLRVRHTNGEESFSGVLLLQRQAQKETPEVSVFPNPGNGIFWLGYTPWESSQNAARISVYDSGGRKLLEQEASPEGKSLLDLTSSGAGLYFVRLFFPDGTTACKKIIVQ